MTNKLATRVKERFIVDTLLILVGLSVFLAGFTLYLKRAFALSRAWGGWCLVFPPLALLYYWRNWPAAKESALLQLGGLSLAFIGILFTINSSVDATDQTTYKMSGVIEPSGRQSTTAEIADSANANKVTGDSITEKVKETVKSTVVELSKTAKQEGSDLIANVQKNRELNGELNNQRFKPNTITWVNNSLRFKQGEKLLGDKEIVILLPASRFKISSGSRLVFQPADVNGPEIHLSWLSQEGSGEGAEDNGSESLTGSPVPETKILKSGYTLELAIGMVNDTQFNAQVLFEYQDTDSSSKLAGSFVASDPDAELVNINKIAQTNLEIETRSTERVEIDKVSGQAQKPVTERIDIANVSARSAEQIPVLSGQDKAEQAKQDKSVDESRETQAVATTLPLVTAGAELAESPDELGQSYQAVSPVTEAVAPEKSSAVAAAEPEPRLVPHTDILEPYLKPETAAVLQQLEPFWGKVVVITASDGNQAEGLLKEIRKNHIAVELRVGTGTMEKLTPVVEFKSVKLK